MHDRPEEALAVLRRIHRDSADDADTFAQKEYDLIVEQERLDRALSTSWATIWRTPSYRKVSCSNNHELWALSFRATLLTRVQRAVLGCMTMLVHTVSGTLVITKYVLHARLLYDSPDQLVQLHA
jgi:hypothetical protein